MSDLDKEDGDPDGPLWYTFTFPLPFGLGLNSNGLERFEIVLTANLAKRAPGSSVWRDPSDVVHFGPNALVRLRFHSRELDPRSLVPEHLNDVLNVFYGRPLVDNATDPPTFGEKGDDYEQWVSLETQGARTVLDGADDQAYAFHRCLRGLNIFLTAYALALGHIEVHPIGTHEIGRLMVRGIYESDGSWGNSGVFLMHPEDWTRSAPQRLLSEIAPQLQAGVTNVMQQHPYLPVKLWFDRAQRAGRDGDQAGRVVSMQTAIESLFFATWAMTFVDNRKSSSQIENLTRTLTPFENLFKSKIPNLLGGDWDRTKRDSPAGRYWNDLYLLRNNVVHGGYLPNEAEGEKAEAAFREIRKHLNDRLWANVRTYPRTVLARLGKPEEQGYPRNAWFDHWRNDMEATETPYTWWLPYDVAGRAADQ